MYTTIVVPLDGSPFGEYALPFAVTLARALGSTLELVHVHRPYEPGEALEALPQYGFQGIVAYDVAADTEALAQQREWLEALAAGLASAHGLRVDAHLLAGPVVRALTEHLRDAGADLVVMSTHGSGLSQHKRLGSVADALVRHLAVPVMVLRPRSAAPPLAVPRRVLVPVDGSRFSESVLRPVVELARQFGAELTFFHVTTPPRAAEVPLQPFVHTAETPLAQPEAYLQSLADTLPAGMPPARLRVVAHEQAARAILDELAGGDPPYDAVAMATHGQVGVHHLLLGSVAEEVLQHTDRPVLLFRPPLAARPPAVEAPVARPVH